MVTLVIWTTKLVAQAQILRDAVMPQVGTDWFVPIMPTHPSGGKAEVA